MNCHDFELAWNERLDDPAASLRLSEPLADHAANCPACQPVHARYLRLSRALVENAAVAAPAVDLTDRILTAAMASGDLGPRRRHHVQGVVWLALAAGVLLAATILLVQNRFQSGTETPQVPVATKLPSPLDDEDLSEAVADATQATWELAREASVPAARLGLAMLESSPLPESAPSFELHAPSVTPDRSVWKSVGERLNEGVRPLEGSARNAFSFLLSSASDESAMPPESQPARDFP